MSHDRLDDLRAALGDRYRIEGKAGQGGMATVYRAEDLKHGRTVAIKVLNAELSASIGAERFQREIQIAARLQHPHILTVHDSGEAAGLLYYVMPFVEGESLRDRLKRESQLPVDDALAITVEVAGALAYAHSRGIIHRDVKPENVLLAQGHAVVADFGIARAASESGEKLTQTGVAIGTAMYMSPEQFAGDEVDARADVYSLGCVLFEMLVGQVPFTGPNMMAIMARHTMEQVPSIRIVRSTVPEDVEDAVFRAMEKSPADRFQSMDDFRKALQGGGTGTWTRTRQHTARYGVPTREIARPRWRRPAAIAAAAGAVVGAGLLILAIDRARTPSAAPDANKVAVLYFEDRTPDGDLRYLADGLTESLIDRLTEVQGLEVISRTGVDGYRTHAAEPDSLPRVASALGVGSIVRGTVDRSGAAIRVSVALHDASGDEVDQERFTGSGDLALRDTVLQQVEEFLRQRLGNLSVRARRQLVRNPEAWTLAQRAEALRKDAERQFTNDSAAWAVRTLERADSLLRGAESRDARWADAPAQLAALSVRRARAARANRETAATLLDSGIAQADRALALEPRHADALEMRGTAHFTRIALRVVEGDAARVALDSAEQDLLAAVRRQPTQATAWATLSNLYYRKPDVAEAKNAAMRAYLADAYLSAADVILTRLFWTNYDQELFAEAKRWCDEGRRRFPVRSFFRECELWLQTAPKGVTIDPDRAWALRDSMTALASPRSRPADARRAEILVAASLARAGLADSARRVLLRAREGAAQVDPDRDLVGNEAVVRVILGDRAEAVRLIKEYLTVHPDHRAGFASGTGWWWRDLQSDPEFRRLVQASG
jgi:TolB-like protein/tRNA A-37 threonylcarbamoyl transferase component Bud32